MINHNSVPDCAAKRLSLYLRQLGELSANGINCISSMRLGRMLQITSAQVRKDLGYFGQFGRPGVGYQVNELVEQIRRILGTDRISRVIVVGTGDLGRAMSRYKGFLKRGFEIVAAFDISEATVGKSVGRVRIHHIDELPRIVWEKDVKLAIVTVPAEAAQSVVEMICRSGVTGILNFAPTVLETPQGVAVGTVDLAASLELLSFRLRNPAQQGDPQKLNHSLYPLRP